MAKHVRMTSGLLYADDLVKLTSYTTALLPSAATAGVGALAWNSTLAALVVSNGTTWGSVSGGGGVAAVYFSAYKIVPGSSGQLNLSGSLINSTLAVSGVSRSGNQVTLANAGDYKITASFGGSGSGASPAYIELYDQTNDFISADSAHTTAGSSGASCELYLTNIPASSTVAFVSSGWSTDGFGQFVIQKLS
jgi:hypothetical protein